MATAAAVVEEGGDSNTTHPSFFSNCISNTSYITTRQGH